MTPTLAGLVERPELALRVLAGDDHLDRSVLWAHTSELADPTDFLEGGELLLTTGIGIGDDRAVQDQYVHRLRAAGVVGLGYGIGLGSAQVPHGLVTAARGAGLPLLEVPRQVPFIAISKAVAKAVAAEEYAAVTRAYQAQQALAAAATRADGVHAVLRQLAVRLDASVVLLDSRGGRRAGDPDLAGMLRPERERLLSWRPPASSTFTLAGTEVAVQSLGTGRRVDGFLAVGTSRRLPPADHHVVNTAASLLTVGLAGPHVLGAAHQRLRTGLLRLMLAGQPNLARAVVAEIWGELPTTPVRLALVGGAARAMAIEVAEDTGGLAFHAALGDLVVLLLSEPATLTGIAGAHIGVSEPVDYGDLAKAHEQARQALALARRAGMAVSRFTNLADDGILRLLEDSAAHVFAQSLLAPLLAHDEHGRGDLVTSLRAWLGHHGQWDPAAARLGVHRHTLRHRIAKVERLLGRSLDSADLRADLWLALRAMDR